MNRRIRKKEDRRVLASADEAVGQGHFEQIVEQLEIVALGLGLEGAGGDKLAEKLGGDSIGELAREVAQVSYGRLGTRIKPGRSPQRHYKIG